MVSSLVAGIPISEVQDESGSVQTPEKDLLRLVTAGSVDDGKSTLIGRLLYDSQSVYEDQLQSVSRTSAIRGNGSLDLSLLTDGLRAEREQGITIDVAYRYFATPKRKFILADTPGHVQYTRNMATGASTAEIAIVLLDARRGVQEQSRRHAYILSLLGISHLVVAVNKMDLVDYDFQAFLDIQQEFTEFLKELAFDEVYWVPISALAGDNVVEPSRNMTWFTGVPVLEYLETVDVAKSSDRGGFRFPVQRVVRPSHDFRGYSGSLSAGVIHPGDNVAILPGGRTTKVKSIRTFDGDLKVAYPPMAVTLELEDDIDISRGDLLCSPRTQPRVSRAFTANVVWFSERRMELGRTYLFKHTSRFMRAEVRLLRHRVNIHTFAREEAEALDMNEIGVADIETTQDVYFDSYAENRSMGSAILIDPDTNLTIAAIMLIAPCDGRDRSKVTADLTRPIGAEERLAKFGHRAAVIDLSGRKSLVHILERKCFDANLRVVVSIDGEERTLLPMVQAGLLVLCLAKPEVPVFHLPGLPEDDNEAAERIFDSLLEMNVVLGA